MGSGKRSTACGILLVIFISANITAPNRLRWAAAACTCCSHVPALLACYRVVAMTARLQTALPARHTSSSCSRMPTAASHCILTHYPADQLLTAAVPVLMLRVLRMHMLLLQHVSHAHNQAAGGRYN